MPPPATDTSSPGVARSGRGPLHVEEDDSSRCRSSSEVLFVEALRAIERRLDDRRQHVDFARWLVRQRASAQRQAVADALVSHVQLGGDPTTQKALEALETAARQLQTSLLEQPLPEPGEADLNAVLVAAHSLLVGFAAAIVKQGDKLPLDLREDIDRSIEVAHRRHVVAGAGGTDVDLPGTTVQNVPMHADAMVGLALSGGGIRSASFALGAIHALAQRGLLSSFDFISAVSGGGYAAAWLGAWSYRHRRGIAGVQEDLREETAATDQGAMRWVRRHCAYLAPRLQTSLFSDVWSLGVSYVTNWLPILVLLSTTLMAALLLPHVLVSGIDLLRRDDLLRTQWRDWVMFGGAVLLLLFAGLLRRLTMFYREPGERARFPNLLPEVVFYGCLLVNLSLSAAVPLLWAAVEDLAGRWVAMGVESTQWLRVYVVLVLLLMASAVASFAIAYLLTRPPSLRTIDALRALRGRPLAPGGPVRRTPGSLLLLLLAATLSSGLSALGLTMLAAASAMPADLASVYLVAFGPLFGLLMFAVAEVVGTTLVPGLRDRDRAWSAKVGGWMLASAFGWTLTCVMSLYLVPAMHLLTSVQVAPYSAPALLVLAVLVRWRFGWSGLGYAAVVLVFVAGLLYGLLALLTVDPFRPSSPSEFQSVVLTFALMVLLAIVFAALTNVNRHSPHALYKEGLVRTFLGASRLARRNPHVEMPLQNVGERESAQFFPRRPDPVTNIDECDDPDLAWLTPHRLREMPLLLLNAAVNGNSPTDFEGRVPRQWPFTFSSLFCGSPVTGIGYARTDAFGQDITLGTAMAVSGAAMSPTSGRTTHPVKAFILGLLNARLGLWIGNPSVPDAVAGTGPRLGGRTVLSEMLGIRRQFRDWIHLSDGGHFENLGVYELVRRGCRRIVVIDSSCDAENAFSDLANAIRRVRIDLGVIIVRDRPVDRPAVAGPVRRRPLRAQAPKAAGVQPKAAVAARGSAVAASAPAVLQAPRSWDWFDIRYGDGLPRGRLLYIKPSVDDTHELPVEVLQYRKLSPSFPHETTADQFFSETQFEAYRALGQRCVLAALKVPLSAGTPNAHAAYDEDPNLVKTMMRAQKNHFEAEERRHP